MNTKVTGSAGEKIAAGYLRDRGYKILETNYFLNAAHGPKVAEIDIIGKIGDCFVFTEVKTVKANGKFLAQDKVNEVKKWKIAKAAEMWLIKNEIPLDVKWRIDVVAVELLPDDRPKIIRTIFGPKCKISHFENVDVG
ncbi:MAG: YraN family protein [Candidatus Pacebacteria bacterium]|jgi:putative endonuclease|nr:YraN family protein [Candidatus Paceibacterota bacterium]